MRFACGVVLYNPREDNIEYLCKISKAFDVFLVYDNGTSEECKLKEKANQYYQYYRNDGLAIPYNKFIDYCYENEIDILCLLDQDTKITIEQITNIIDHIIDNYSDDYIIYAPRLRGTKGTSWVINSNAFLNICELKTKQIKYDEYYFLDRLDADFCMQIKRAGKKILIFEDVIVDHRIGEGKYNEHSAIRHYYMSRNRNYYNRKFYSQLVYLTKTLLQDVRHILQIMIYESNRKVKIKEFLRGKFSYFSERE